MSSEQTAELRHRALAFELLIAAGHIHREFADKALSLAQGIRMDPLPQAKPVPEPSAPRRMLGNLRDVIGPYIGHRPHHQEHDEIGSPSYGVHSCTELGCQPVPAAQEPGFSVSPRMVIRDGEHYEPLPTQKPVAPMRWIVEECSPEIATASIWGSPQQRGTTVRVIAPLEPISAERLEALAVIFGTAVNLSNHEWTKKGIAAMLRACGLTVE